MEEYIEILDEEGISTGEIKERNAVHKDGDWHKVIQIFIVNGDLIQENGVLQLQDILVLVKQAMKQR